MHAVLFEVGALVLTTPILAWGMGISLLDALLIDIGFILACLEYAVVYSWVYDSLGGRLPACFNRAFSRLATRCGVIRFVVRYALYFLYRLVCLPRREFLFPVALCSGHPVKHGALLTERAYTSLFYAVVE